ncbi:MAG TPA: Tim44/TimA family putative adaptor protein [Stellaceae bacterium]|nr:Tim44/TimA family putative adaptor protein [Stellaceae bacterium]
MGGEFQIISIVVSAAIAVFLLFRLRGVLGRRTGHERYRDPFARGPGAPVPGAPPPSGPIIDATANPAPPPQQTAPLESGVAALKGMDRNFDERAFLQGARGAFEIIVNAFAHGDTAALRPLLSDDVYGAFSGAIAERQAQKETHETTLVSIKSCDLTEARVEGSVAHVTVRFVSDQVNVTRAADGSVVDGEPDRVVEKTDLWTFARDTRSRDPNWHLVATRST